MGSKHSKQSSDIRIQTSPLDNSTALETERPKERIFQWSKGETGNSQGELKKNSRKLIDFSSIGSKFNHSKSREIFHKIAKPQKKVEATLPFPNQQSLLPKKSTSRPSKYRRINFSILKEPRDEKTRSKMYSFTDSSTPGSTEEKQGLILDDWKSDLLPKLQNFASSAIYDKILNETPLISETSKFDPEPTTLEPSHSEFKYPSNSGPPFGLSNFAFYPQAVPFQLEQPIEYSRIEPAKQFCFLDQVPRYQYPQYQNPQMESSQFLNPVLENSQIQTSYLDNQQLLNSMAQISENKESYLQKSQVESSQLQVPNPYSELSHIPSYLIEAFQPEAPSSVPIQPFSFNQPASEVASQGPMRYWPDFSTTTVSASWLVPRITDDLTVDLPSSSRKRLQLSDPQSPSIKEEEPRIRLNIIQTSKTDIDEESKYVINIPKKHLLSFDGEMSLPKLAHKTSLGVD